jgi:hypothetical protein
MLQSDEPEEVDGAAHVADRQNALPIVNSELTVEF